MKHEPAQPQTTEFHRHILSPRRSPTGRAPLCGEADPENMSYGGLDEAYTANVEGWASGTPCLNCLKVAMIAMGVSP